MNRQQLFLWMNDPVSLQPEDIGSLKEVIADYPFFQTARILNVLHLKHKQDYRFEMELKRVATFAPDRARLRDLLIKSETSVDKQKDLHLKQLEEQILASLKEIELKKSRLQELIEEKKAITGNKSDVAEISETDGQLPFRPLPKDKLLDEFLMEKQFTPEKKGIFYNPEDSAQKSIEESDDILSETLARLVAAQGKNDKAIKIYQKLMLKYPQKSSYFAAQIEKLRKES